MNRPWHIWTAFAACLAVALAAMGWISVTAVRLDRAQGEAQRQAALEENVRLALWRMDSFAAPLLVQENARPCAAYTSFYAVSDAYTNLFVPIKRGSVLVPSPLLTQKVPNILLHFQFGPDGGLTSPQVPGTEMQEVAGVNGVTVMAIGQAERRLSALQALARREALLAVLPPLEQGTGMPVYQDNPVAQAARAQQPGQTQVLGVNAAELREQQVAQQRERNDKEWQARQNAYYNTNFAANIGNGNMDQQDAKVAVRPAVGRVGPMQPMWMGEALALARRVEVGKRTYVQGCWLDWPALRGQLMALVTDLLPAATLEPIRGDEGNGYGRRLASLPVRLVPGEVPLPPGAAVSPIQVSLVVAWACMVLAAGAVAVLLRGAVVLSERRGAFVSAVTHEMRTPLTTFRMYSEMLAGGMVPQEKRQGYLETLRTEADRLGHLVENVLAYARLERGSTKSRMQVIGAGELLDRMKERLAQRAEQAEMQLVFDGEPDKLALEVRTDPSAVEQILFNLVDNACKYAATAEDRRVHVEVEEAHGSMGAREHGSMGAWVRRRAGGRTRGNGEVVVRVRDHGPGIPADESGRLFRPFRKSARDAANSGPGVGLGLALSRRLARRMGGDLVVDHSVPDGACFRLTLRKA